MKKASGERYSTSSYQLQTYDGPEQGNIDGGGGHLLHPGPGQPGGEQYDSGDEGAV